MIEWLAVRGLITVQDGGRSRGLGLGLAEGGVVDREAFALLNHLLGDDPGTPVLEVLGAGFTGRLRLPLTLALVGHPRPAWADGIPVPFYAATTFDAGTVLELADGPGAYVLLGVAGGVDGVRRLGSVSEVVSIPALGWHRLTTAGTVTLMRCPVPRRTARQLGEAWWLPYGSDPIAVWPGPDRVRDLPAPALVEAVGRIGVRAKGTPLPAPRAGHASRPTVRGTIEVDRAGTSMILGPERQTTGGYAMPWVVSEWDLGRVFDARPGDRLTFLWMTPDRWRQRRDRALKRLAAAVAGRPVRPTDD